MRRALLLSLVLTACVAQQPPAPAPAPQPRPQLAATGVARRVVLLSFDGLSADMLASQPGLRAFEWIAREGTSARVIPVNPSATAPAHVAIFTGADPQKNGVIANAFHVRGRPVEEAAVGMKTEIEVETLLDAARRQGKRTGDVTFPTIDASSPRRSADFGMIWTTPLTRGRILRLKREDFHREWVPPTWTPPRPRRQTFSPVMRARLEWTVPQRARLDVDVVAWDTTDDGQENYDSFTIESEDREIPVDEKGWFAITRRATEALFGSWSKILHADPALNDVAIYWGAIARNECYPESYQRLIDDEVGFFPSPPDEAAGVDAATFAEQVERIADFFTRAQVLTIRRMEFDLLFMYQPQLDEAGHAWLGRAGGEPVLRAAYASADRALGAIAAALDLSRDALVVTGDHGMSPVNTIVRMNRLLADGGFAPRWRAYASGQIAHLYRFAEPDDTAAVVNMLTASGHFERVETKSAAMHPNSGDVIVTANPNVVLSPSSDPPAAGPSSSAGAHGGLETNRRLHTALFAIGAGTGRGNLGDVDQKRIARFVSALLGISAPAAAD